jgi:Protein of unknown function (DUF2490)
LAYILIKKIRRLRHKAKVAKYMRLGSYQLVPYKLLACYLITGLLCTSVAFAQTHTDFYWVKGYLKLRFSERNSLHIDLEERRLINPHKENQLLIQSHYHHQLNKGMDVAAGIEYSRQNTLTSIDFVVPEYRLFQEINFFQKLSPQLEIQHRYRLEERWQHNSISAELLEGYKFATRLRYRLQATYQFTKAKVKAFNEIMVHTSKGISSNVFDQNRVYIGAEYPISSQLTTELGGMYIWQQSSNNTNASTRNIIRLSFYYTLKMK